MLHPNGKAVTVIHAKRYDDGDTHQLQHQMRQAGAGALPEECRLRHHLTRFHTTRGTLEFVLPRDAAAMILPFLGWLFPAVVQAAAEQLLQAMSWPVATTERALLQLEAALPLIAPGDIGPDLIDSLTRAVGLLSQHLLVPVVQAGASEFCKEVKVCAFEP